MDSTNRWIQQPPAILRVRPAARHLRPSEAVLPRRQAASPPARVSRGPLADRPPVAAVLARLRPAVRDAAGCVLRLDVVVGGHEDSRDLGLEDLQRAEPSARRASGCSAAGAQQRLRVGQERERYGSGLRPERHGQLRGRPP